MKHILIRPERCVGCLSCQIACSVAHSQAGSLTTAVLVGEPLISRIFVESTGESKAPLNCRHCTDAPCISACIAGAMYRKENGLVTNIGGEKKCIGCWMCVMMCPFGVIKSDVTTNLAVKCDQECEQETGVPACVRSCPTHALVFREVQDFSTAKRQEFWQSVLD